MSVAAEAETRAGGRGRKGRSAPYPAPPPCRHGRRAAMRAAGPVPVPGGGSAPAPAPRLPRGGRGVRRARPSFVDESLFGRPAGARPPPPAFAPPWAAAVAAPGGGGSPRPRSKCRLRSHAPSFCDETLFGAKAEAPAWAAPWMRKEDVAKLHPLLWSPPPAPRNQPGLTPRSSETPLRAVHPPASVSPATAGSEVGREGKSCVWKRPASHPGSGRGRSQSLGRLHAPSDGLRPASDNLRTERCKNQSPPTAPATPRGPLVRGRSKSASRPPLARTSKAVGGCQARPPWK
ncbi:LOW QUALITY PROTEIN: RBPJ-interacting and tubulin-associated protein 1 [Leptosomus discolor]